MGNDLGVAIACCSTDTAIIDWRVGEQRRKVGRIFEKGYGAHGACFEPWSQIELPGRLVAL